MYVYFCKFKQMIPLSMYVFCLYCMDCTRICMYVFDSILNSIVLFSTSLNFPFPRGMQNQRDRFKIGFSESLTNIATEGRS